MNNFEITLKMLQEGVDYFQAMELLTEEAATVARENNYVFMIYPEPLCNPSFHVRYKDEWEVVLEILSFKILEVKHGKFKKGTYLPKKIMKDIYLALGKEIKNGLSNWFLILQLWNVNNNKYKVDIDKKIPVYFKKMSKSYR